MTATWIGKRDDLNMAKVFAALALLPLAGGSCELAPVDAMVKVAPWAHPPVSLAAPVAAARGELIHLQAVLTGRGSSSGATAAVVTAKVASLGPVTVRQVGYTHLNLTFNESRPTGVYPVTLLPLSPTGSTADVTPLALPTGAPTVFWLSISVPRGATPGVHRGSVSVAGAGCGSTAVSASFTVQVSSFTLPESPTQLTVRRPKQHAAWLPLFPLGGCLSEPCSAQGAQFERKSITQFQGSGAHGTGAENVFRPETAVNFFKSFKVWRSKCQSALSQIYFAES